MGKIVNALILSAGFAAASGAQADGFPNPFCLVSDKGIATIYARVSAGEFRPETRSETVVRRETTIGEDIEGKWKSWTGNKTYKPPVTQPVLGTTGTYHATTLMLSFEGDKSTPRFVPEYGGGITVNITDWQRNKPIGTCSTGSTVTGQTTEVMPIYNGRLPKLTLDPG